MRILHHSLLLAAMVICTAVAKPDSAATTDLDAKKAQADSLQQKADSLDKKATQLEEQLNGIEENRSDLREELEAQIEDLRGAIGDIRKNVEKTLSAIKDAQEAAVEKMEDQIEVQGEKKHTGSFIFALEYSHLDVDPLKYLQNHDKTLMGKYAFDFSNKSMLMFGLMGYYNMDNNVRVGNGINAGYKSFQSAEYATTSFDSILNTSESVDSIVTLRVIPASIGFICEKAFVYDPVNFFAGIMLGGNLTLIVKEEQEAELESSFISDDSDNDHDSRYSVAFAPAVAWDIHGGIAFKVSRVMHIGIDGVVRFAYAYEGYGAGFGDFLSINPGIRLRLTFGSAG